MDQALLVAQAHALTRRLDQTRAKPRAVMWVKGEDTDTWRLWIVPSEQVKDKREFYRLVADAISHHRDEMQGLDVGSTEYVERSHPAMRGMAGFLSLRDLGNVRFAGNRFNDFYLPDGIVIRMDLAEPMHVAS